MPHRDAEHLLLGPRSTYVERYLSQERVLKLKFIRMNNFRPTGEKPKTEIFESQVIKEVRFKLELGDSPSPYELIEKASLTIPEKSNIFWLLSEIDMDELNNKDLKLGIVPLAPNNQQESIEQAVKRIQQSSNYKLASLGQLLALAAADQGAPYGMLLYAPGTLSEDEHEFGFPKLSPSSVETGYASPEFLESVKPSHAALLTSRSLSIGASDLNLAVQSVNSRLACVVDLQKDLD